MTYEEVMKSSLLKLWQQAIDADLKALSENNTWAVIDEHNDCNIIDSNWIIKIKRDNKGKTSLFKCKLAARGLSTKRFSI